MRQFNYTSLVCVQRGLVLKLHMMSPIASLESAPRLGNACCCCDTTTFQRKLPGDTKTRVWGVGSLLTSSILCFFVGKIKGVSVLRSTSSKCNWQMKQRSDLAHMEVGASPTRSDNSFAFLNVPYMLHIHHCNLAFRCMQQDTHHTQRAAAES